jgi:hypothetical protein
MGSGERGIGIRALEGHSHGIVPGPLRDEQTVEGFSRQKADSGKECGEIGEYIPIR